MNQREAMTDGRLAEIRKLAGRSPYLTSNELSYEGASKALQDLVDEIDRMRACKGCDGAGVLFNDNGTAQPAHGWTGPLIDASVAGAVIRPGEAMVCLTCKAMKDAQA